VVDGGLPVPGRPVAVRQLVEAGQDDQKAEDDAGAAAEQEELLER
jgi:hypothetical protein